MIFEIRNRFITRTDGDNPIADNADYVCHFDFDSEWEGKVKVARFVTEAGEAYDVPIVNDECIAAAMPDGIVKVGVYTAEMTTGYVKVYYKASIKTDSQLAEEPTPDVVTQILERIDDAVEESVFAFAEEHKEVLKGTDGVSPTATVVSTSNGARFTVTDKNGTTTATLTNGRNGDPGEPGEPGTPGKSAYVLALDNGFHGTEAEWLESLKGSGRQVAYDGEETSDTLIKLTEEEGIPIDLSEVITDKSLKFIESNDFRLVNSLQAIIADIDNFNKVMYMGNYPYINKYDISTDSPTLVKSIFYENFGFASTATNNGKAMSFLARNCVIIGDYIYYAVRNSSGQNMDTSANACNGGILIIKKSDFTVVGHLALPHLVTWVTKYSRNGIDYIFANLRTEGFKLYEVTTNPLVPTLVYDGSLPHDSAATNEHQAGYIVNLPSGKTLYVAMGFANAIFFYDIDDLSNIVLLKKITVGTASNRDVNVGHTYSAYVNYPYMYCTAASSLSLAYKTSGLFRLDISDIENGNVGIKMHLVDESLSSQISAGDMQPSYVERWGNHLLVPANEKGIYVYRLLDDGDIKYEGTWVIDSKRVKSEGYDTKPCKIFHCKSDYLGRLFVPESDIMNQSDVSVMQNGREPYRRCHIYKLINRIV